MSRPRVLIVDDQEAVRTFLARALGRLDYEVVGEASTGLSAIEITQRETPDLVLMDIELEGAMDGIEAADVIREQSDCPVVFLTGNAEEAVLQRAKITQAFGYVLKPFRTRELRSVIEMALYKAKMEADLRRSERWFAATLNCVADGVVATDEIGAIVFFNPAAEQLTGWNENDALKRKVHPVLDIFDPTREFSAVELVNEALAAKRVHHAEPGARLRRLDGESIPIEIHAAPIRGEDEPPTGVVIVFRDITDRRRLEREILEISNREQERIGQDLHDGLMQHLSGINFLAKAMTKKLTDQQSANATDAKRISDLMNDAVRQSNGVARGLFPVELERNGLEAALIELVSNAEVMSEVPCSFACAEPIPVDDHDVAIHMYRIAQEAVTNALKHGDPNNVEVQLEKADAGIRLLVRNDGNPMAPDLAHADGMGLHIMRYRANIIGASLTFRTDPDGWVEVSCHLLHLNKSAPNPKS